jgi:antitoxin (DNA-binding transcriptional repressor) of toxin-antitoxin stability system
LGHWLDPASPPKHRVYTAQNLVQLKPPETIMSISIKDVIPLSLARANLSELADQVKGGAEKIITKNGQSYVALIDAERLNYYHQLERTRIHLLTLEDANKGLADIEAGRFKDAGPALHALKQGRKKPD